MTVSCDTWRERLAAAEDAVNTLQMGGQVALIRTGDKEVRYHKSNINDLVRYVRYLQGKVDACDGLPASPGFIQMTPTDC